MHSCKKFGRRVASWLSEERLQTAKPDMDKDSIRPISLIYDHLDGADLPMEFAFGAIPPQDQSFSLTGKP